MACNWLLPLSLRLWPIWSIVRLWLYQYIMAWMIFKTSSKDWNTTGHVLVMTFMGFCSTRGHRGQHRSPTSKRLTCHTYPSLVHLEIALEIFWGGGLLDFIVILTLHSIVKNIFYSQCYGINFTFCSKNKHSSLEMSGSCKIQDPMNVLSHENTTRVWSDLCVISRDVYLNIYSGQGEKFRIWIWHKSG